MRHAGQQVSKRPLARDQHIGRQDRLGKQSVEIDTQITDQEKVVQGNRQRLISSFLAMESARQKSNQQLQYLSQRFGTASS